MSEPQLMEAAVSAAMRGEKCELPDEFNPLPRAPKAGERLWKVALGEEIALKLAIFDRQGNIGVHDAKMFMLVSRDRVPEGWDLTFSRLSDVRMYLHVLVCATLAFDAHGDCRVLGETHWVETEDDHEDTSLPAEILPPETDVAALREKIERQDERYLTTKSSLLLLAGLVEKATDAHWRNRVRRELQ